MYRFPKSIINLIATTAEKSQLSKRFRFNKMTPTPITHENTSSIQNPNLSINKKPKLLTISVDGNISSGKSTLVSTLEDIFPKDFKYAVETVPEPLEKWTNLQGHNLLEMLYQDRTKNNFLFQHYVQLTRLMDTIRNSDENPELPDGFVGKIKIMERSL